MPKEGECCATCAVNRTPERDMMVACDICDLVPVDYWCPYYKKRNEEDE